MKAVAGFISAVALIFTVGCGKTDAGITTAVKSKLAADDTVKAYQVNVTTDHKVVTLSGNVETAAQKEHAVTIARNTDGVADVIDQLQVGRTEATTGRTDIDDRAEAEARQDSSAVADATKKGVDKTESAVKEGAAKTKAGAKKTGEKIKDVFTDDNKDSDHDGK